MPARTPSTARAAAGSPDEMTAPSGLSAYPQEQLSADIQELVLQCAAGIRAAAQGISNACDNFDAIHEKSKPALFQMQAWNRFVDNVAAHKPPLALAQLSLSSQSDAAAAERDNNDAASEGAGVASSTIVAPATASANFVSQNSEAAGVSEATRATEASTA